MKYLLLIILFFSFGFTFSQNLNSITISENENGTVFLEYLKSIEAQYKIDFVCDEARMEALTITNIKGSLKLRDFLSIFLGAYTIEKAADDIYFIIPKNLSTVTGFNKQNVIALDPNSSRYSFAGQIRDGKTGDALTGARVYLPQLKKGDASNLDGNFSITNLPQEVLVAEIEFVGYQREVYVLGFSNLARPAKFTATLFPAATELDEVTVRATRIEQNVLGNLSGVETLSSQSLKAIPTFLGEIDPIRSITTLPGVSTVGELASGFNVRGGEAGQNLILQDGAPIYNPSHLFGFFSAFNPDMVSSVTLYKGGGPANYGGRLSSVLDISLRKGDDAKHTIKGSAGLISSRLSIEGPIVKGKTSYLVGGRISYANWLITATDNIQLRSSSADFHDVTARVFHTINDNNLVTLSFYRSEDSFKFATDSIFSWGTTNVAMKWDHTFNQKVSSALTLHKSHYTSGVESLDELEKFTYQNSIDAYGLKYDVTINTNDKIKLITGLETSLTLLEPGMLVPSQGAVNVERENLNDQRAGEIAAYIQSDIDISRKFSVSAGLRYSQFIRLGPDDVFTFDYNNPEGRYPSISDTTHFGNNEKIATYNGLEPRVSLRYLLRQSSSLKASYYRGYQYLHLISNTSSTTPQDYWVASGPYLKPQISDQYSVGYFQNLRSNKYEASIEAFYRDIKNSVDYIEGAEITMNPALEAGLLQGVGRAYGVEFFLKKNEGKINGWLSYTYSRSLRRFDTETGRLTINEGDYYAAAYDQPHRVSLITNYRLSPRVIASANFNYNTGRPITIPVSKFTYEGYLSVLNYSQRNEYRIPDYHRLDLSLTIKENPRSRHRIRGEWTFSIFNVYGRKNAYSIFFDRYGNARKLSVLGSVFPSLTYSFTI